MRTRDLVKKLRARFGDGNIIIGIEILRIIEYRYDGTIVLEGVIVAAVGDKGICGGSIIRAECNFVNAIYSPYPGSAVFDAIIDRPLIYSRIRTNLTTYLLYVPCKITNVDINKFEVVTKLYGTCPFEGTDKCPLYRAKHQSIQV
jgi:hypothetical protein